MSDNPQLNPYEPPQSVDDSKAEKEQPAWVEVAAAVIIPLIIFLVLAYLFFANFEPPPTRT